VINAIRAHLAEFGIVAPVGRNGVEQLLDLVVHVATFAGTGHGRLLLPRRWTGRRTALASGRDAGRIAEEIVSHLTGLMNSTVKVTLEIHAQIPSGAPDEVVRTLTENGTGRV
jgi:hypothetical protein